MGPGQDGGGQMPPEESQLHGSIAQGAPRQRHQSVPFISFYEGNEHKIFEDHISVMIQTNYECILAS